MKILVTIKEVADPESHFVIHQSGTSVMADEKSIFRMNRYDEFALEEALLIKEELSGVTVTALSVGPEKVKAVLKRAVEMGADDTLLIQTDGGGENSPSVVSKLISDYIKSEGYDLIITGVMAEDTLQGQTGQMIAGHLGISCASSVVARTFGVSAKTIKVERELDALNRESVTLSMPALITVQSGINRPRYPSLTNKLRAKEQKVLVVEAPGDILGSSRTKTSFAFINTEKETSILDGTVQEKASELVQIIREKGVL